MMMINTNTDVTTVTPSSTFVSASATESDLDRLAASLYHLMSYRCEPSAKQADQHSVYESVAPTNAAYSSSGGSAADRR
jgi:hypothetical protein